MVLYYPSITKEEFEEGCRELEQRYISSQDQSLTDFKFDGRYLYIRQNRGMVNLPENVTESSDLEWVEDDPVPRPLYQDRVGYLLIIEYSRNL